MISPATTRKEATWLACKQKSCCYAAFVLPSGRDIWRISRTLDMPPWAFVVYFQSPEPRPDAFMLDPAGPRFRLALAKQRSRRTKTPPPCIFLLRTRQGHHRCGLGDLRPVVCKSYPAELVSGVLCLRNDGGCTCRAWSLTDVEIAEETALVEERQAGYAEYCAVIARWNALVASAPPEASFTFFDFCQYLLEAYDEIDTPSMAESLLV